ncbi:hypothetical protein C2I36_05355 [Rhodobacteraceae bacterium WD3A24]|nr:hypothetical protein C2I36_05355 [Rhodobacteraceae bacterium WD3A24]
MRFLLSLVGLALLVACSPRIPDSGAGVGFGEYGRYMREREAQSEAARGAQQTQQPQQQQPQQQPGAPLSAIDGIGTPGDEGAAGGGAVSDSQDFEAVAERETLESDRERLEQQRAQYREVQPTDLPDSGQDGAPSVVAFALRTSHPIGEERYSRFPFHLTNWQSNCAGFRSQDEAQETFLSRGGPERDPGNLDPDGDGYACWWDPAPYRAAARTSQ